MKKKSNPKDVKKGCSYMVVIVAVLSMFIYFTCDSESDTPMTKQEIHNQNIQKLFSGWDGSHIKLTKKIKEGLNDPESYEHIQTTYKDYDNFLIVNTIFTAKNGFGGTLKKEVIVQSDTLGNVTEVLQWID